MKSVTAASRHSLQEPQLRVNYSSSVVSKEMLPHVALFTANMKINNILMIFFSTAQINPLIFAYLSQ